MRPDGAEHVTEVRDLLSAQCIGEVVLDGAQMRSGCASQRFNSVVGEDDEGSTVVAGALLAAQKAASFHSTEMVGEPAAFPIDRVCELGRTQRPSSSLRQGEQHGVVARR